jgi:hypothetical protein
MQTPNFFQNPPKGRLWGMAHGSIRIQEGDPNLIAAAAALIGVSEIFETASANRARPCCRIGRGRRQT